jgi:hypothetical protein
MSKLATIALARRAHRVCRATALSGAIVTAIACGKAAEHESSTAAVPSVGGSYPTQVTLVRERSTCPSVTVQDNVTTIVQTAGALTFSLTHAGNKYDGTVDSVGRFSTATSTLTSGASKYAITVTGQFTGTGFDAMVQVGVQQPTPPTTCAYIVHWVGTKSGGANSLRAQ